MGILKAKDFIQSGTELILKDRAGYYFWNDIWVGEQSLRQRFPALFKISKGKKLTVKNMVTDQGAWNLQFARALNELEVQEVIQLLQVIGDPNDIINNAARDDRHWRYGNDEGFSVASAYKALETEGFISFPDKQLWNPKVPLKVSFLVWTLCYNGACTLDYLYKAGLVQNVNCLLCGAREETNAHIFLHCKTTFEVWTYFLRSFGINWVFANDIRRTLWEWKNKKSKKMIDRLWGYLTFAIWWNMWRERNNRLYNNLNRPTKQIIMEVKALLYNWAMNTII